MENKIRLSVIMSCYNEEQVVGRAIESILNQTFRDFEFLIVDDASTDETFSICQSYTQQDARIRLFRLNENTGSCSVPLNFAVREVQTQLIARMDADDVSHPTRLEKQFAFLQAHPEIDILGTGINLIDKETKEKVGESTFKILHKDIIKARYRKPFVAHPTVMLRKKIYDNFGGYNETVSCSQDSDLWLKAFKQFKFHNLPEILFDYYRRPKTMGLAENSWFFTTMKIKYRAMKRNKELYRYWPALIEQSLYFLYHKFFNRWIG